MEDDETLAVNLDGTVRSAISQVERANRRRDGVATRQIVNQVRVPRAVHIPTPEPDSPLTQIIIARVGTLEAKIDARIDVLKTDLDTKTEALKTDLGAKTDALDAKIDALKTDVAAILALLQQNAKPLWSFAQE